jgi:hypothetical protein
MTNRPPATVESLLRETMQQVSLLLELQQGLPLVCAPRDWVDGWDRMLAEALRLLRQEGGGG